MLKSNKGEGLGSGLGLFPFVLSWPLLTRDAPDFNYTEYEVVMSDEQHTVFHSYKVVSLRRASQHICSLPYFTTLLHQSCFKYLLVFIKCWFTELCWKLLFNSFEHNIIFT